MGAPALPAAFSAYLAQWTLQPDGEPMVTPNAQLLPVRWRGMAAMLKVATEAEEKCGAALMAWWQGQGAAKVLAYGGDALLLERAQGIMNLAEFARHGRDDEACSIMCEVVAQLHRPRMEKLPVLVGLRPWFQALHDSAAVRGGIFAAAAATAQELLAAPQDVVVLHGDIHHGNILDFGPRGWLAIDPKGLLGERGFDYANLFCNPDAQTACNPERFERRLEVVAAAAGLERKRLLQWILAWAGLSAAWHLEDGSNPDAALAVAHMAAARL